MYKTRNDSPVSKTIGSAIVRLLGFSLWVMAIAVQAAEPKLLTVETVAAFDGPMPTGGDRIARGPHLRQLSPLG